MNDLKLSENLFDLTSEQEETSKMMYDGKVIKCLVAPYHSYKQLEEILPYTKTTYLFPEKEMSMQQVTGFISMIVSNTNITDEVRIVTANQNVIIDMVDACVRILTEGGDIVESPEKTFMANIHTIRHCLLENDAHRISDEERTSGMKSVNDLITKINEYTDSGKTMDESEYDALIMKVSQIGEPLIGDKLKQMARRINVGKAKPTKSKETLENELAEALANEDYESAAEIKKDLDSI